MTDRYGNVKAIKIYNARKRLCDLIRTEGTPAIQDALDRLMPWIDAPEGFPLNGGE